MISYFSLPHNVLKLDVCFFLTRALEYIRIWIKVPTKVSEDTVFPFNVGEPCLVEINTEELCLKIKPISDKEAVELVWRKRRRRK